jgi:hypothetical protein
MKKILLLVLPVLFFYLNTCGQLITYKAPAGVALNKDFAVKVREKGKAWQPLAVYLAKVAGNAKPTGQINIENTSFAYFDFAGNVEVAVTFLKGKVNKARVRPFAAGQVKVTGNTISFSLTEPRNLSVEVNGDIFHNLQLFANPLETVHPNASDKNVLYFGPGIHKVDTVTLRSNQTVYIAGGAVVQGSFKAYRVRNVKIMGHGIIDHPVRSIEIGYSKNVSVDGVIILNPKHYTTTIGQSDKVSIRNLKSFSCEGWGDGIDIFCSSNVLIDGVFMRNSDDCIAIYGHRFNWYGNTKNITVQNATLWADIAHPILIGTHGDPPHPDTLGNMKFSNIDILEHRERQIDYQGCMALNAGDNNLISDIRFEDIRVDDFSKGQVVNMRVMFNHKYNTAAGMGIRNIYFKNIGYTGTHANMGVITGYDEAHLIKNITFEHLSINGKVISDHMPGKPNFYKTGDMANIFIGEHVEGLTFIP